MKGIFSLSMLLVFLFVLGCAKEKEELPITGEATSIDKNTDYMYDIGAIGDLGEINQEENEAFEEETGAEEDNEEGIDKVVGLCKDYDDGAVSWRNGTVFEFYDEGKRIIATVLDSDAPPRIEKKVEKKEEKKEVKLDSVRLCYDTDNGIIKWVNGTVFGFYHNAQSFEFQDYCMNRSYLTEFYCENETPTFREFYCKNGCKDNHCL